jgi:hypothetical protein
MQEGPPDAAGDEVPAVPLSLSALFTHSDIPGQLLDVQDPCEDVFERFRMMRLVSHGVQRAVDVKMTNAAWLQALRRRAADFCDDVQPGVVLPEGTARGAGLRRLLAGNRFDDVANGLREFAQDADTQSLIIGLLLRKLGVGDTHHRQNRILASTTVNFNLHRALSRTIRLHFSRPDIVRRAVILMSMFTDVDANRNKLHVPADVCEYVVETMLQVQTMLEVMHVRGSIIPIMIRQCLYIIWTVTAHHVPQNIKGQVLIDVLAKVVHNRIGHCSIVEEAMVMMVRCMAELDLSKEDDRSLVLSFDVAQVANTILVAAKVHLRVHKNVARACLDALSSLNEIITSCHHTMVDWNTAVMSDTAAADSSADFIAMVTGNVGRMQPVADHLERCRPMMQRDRTLKLAVTVLMAFGDDVEIVEQVVRVALSVIDHYWEPQDPPAEQPNDHSRTLFPGTTFIPIIVLAMRSLPFSAVTKSMCASLFQLLHIVCKNHAVHTEFVVDNMVLALLTSHYAATVQMFAIDNNFLYQRHRFEQLLLIQTH